MSIQCTIKGVRTDAWISTHELMDTGATHEFIDSNFVERHKIPVTPCEGSMQVANGSAQRILGEAALKVCIEGHQFKVKCYVTDMGGMHTLILGERILREHKAI